MASRCLSRQIGPPVGTKWGGGGDAEVSEEEGHEISALLKPNPRDAGLQDAG